MPSHHGIGSDTSLGISQTHRRTGTHAREEAEARGRKASSKQKDLEKSISILRGQLTRTEKALTKAKNRADRWRKEAKTQKKSATRAHARVEKLHQKLDAASTALEAVHSAAPVGVMSSGRAVSEPTTVDGAAVPDETWSVVRLRAEARTRGLTGMSNKSKAQLLAALS
jgi:hypothetical protein